MFDFFMYTTKSCKWCVEAKNLLTRNGHTYEEYFVDEDAYARAAFDSMSFKTVPQIFLKAASPDEMATHIGGYYDLRKWLETKDNAPQ